MFITIVMVWYVERMDDEKALGKEKKNVIKGLKKGRSKTGCIEALEKDMLVRGLKEQIHWAALNGGLLVKKSHLL